MSSEWNLNQTTLEVKSWLRSPAQNIRTGLKEDWTISADIERVVTSGSDIISKQHLTTVHRRMSQISEDSRVQEIQRLLSELIAEWYQEDNLENNNVELF